MIKFLRRLHYRREAGHRMHRDRVSNRFSRCDCIFVADVISSKVRLAKEVISSVVN
jgi:hypothetical protein